MLKKSTWIEWSIKGVTMVGLINVTMDVLGFSVISNYEGFYYKWFWLIFFSLITLVTVVLGKWHNKRSLGMASFFPLIVCILYGLLKLL